MSEPWQSTETEQDTSAISKFDVSSQKPDEPKEKGRLRKYWEIVWPWAKGASIASKGLSQRYAEAEVAGKETANQVQAEEAANIAAKTDIAKAQHTKMVFDLIEQAVANPGPDAALKLSLLAQEHPEIFEKLEEIEAKLAKWKMLYGTTVELSNGGEKGQAEDDQGRLDADETTIQK